MSKKRTEHIPGPDITMSPEERAEAEREKAELLQRLGAKPNSLIVRITPAEPTPKPTPKPAAPPLILEPPTGPTVAELQAQLKATEAAIAEAKRRETAYKQAQAAAQQRQAAGQAAVDLAPLTKQLEHALREVSRVQAEYGPRLKDMNRSCASGDLETRRALSEMYGAAGTLGGRLGEARATLEAAAKGVRYASETGRDVDQAKTLAAAALTVNVIELETEAKVLTSARKELRGGAVSPTLPDHLDPRSLLGPDVMRQDVADLGRII